MAHINYDISLIFVKKKTLSVAIALLCSVRQRRPTTKCSHLGSRKQGRKAPRKKHGMVTTI